MLLRSFRPALARLAYTHPRTNEVSDHFTLIDDTMPERKHACTGRECAQILACSIHTLLAPPPPQGVREQVQFVLRKLEDPTFLAMVRSTANANLPMPVMYMTA